MIERTRGETFPTRRPFEDFGAERGFDFQRRATHARAQRAAAEQLRTLRARRRRRRRREDDKTRLRGLRLI
jgi:hypothetical protein